jgi:type IV secretory pathway TrbD component
VRLISGAFAAIVAAIGVFQLVVALVVVLVVAVGFGVRLFLRAVAIDRSFTEILHKQNQQRVLLSSGRAHPRPLPRPGR